MQLVSILTFFKQQLLLDLGERVLGIDCLGEERLLGAWKVAHVDRGGCGPLAAVLCCLVGDGVAVRSLAREVSLLILLGSEGVLHRHALLLDAAAAAELLGLVPRQLDVALHLVCRSASHLLIAATRRDGRRDRRLRLVFVARPLGGRRERRAALVTLRCRLRLLVEVAVPRRATTLRQVSLADLSRTSRLLRRGRVVAATLMHDLLAAVMRELEGRASVRTLRQRLLIEVIHTFLTVR